MGYLLSFNMNFQAFPSQKIREIVKNNQVKNSNSKNIQPASLDLTLSGEAYRMRWAFLPRPGEKISKIIKNGSFYPFDLSRPLEPGGIYLIRLNETLELPDDIFVSANNKSSTGRLNIQSRLVADGVARFDCLPFGYRGSLWVEVVSKSFFIKLSPGDALNQIRFFTRQKNDDFLIRDIYKNYGIFYNRHGKVIESEEILAQDNDNSLVMTLNLDAKSAATGYKAIYSTKVLDFSKENSHLAGDFFEEIKIFKNKEIVLNSGDFYIFSTKEFIRVPPEFSFDMNAYDVGVGEFRSHYAGFFDPGFGYGLKGEILGTPAVLEIRPYDNNFVVRDGQPICKMTCVKMTEIPDMVYGAGNIGSHYQNQRGPKLSKHFK